MTASASLFDSAFLARLEQLHLLARRLFRGERRAERRSRQIGSSLNFADHREYTPGDEPRTIDWHAYGRLGRLFVKLYEHEQDLPVSFLIDCSASMRWLPDEGAADGVPPCKFDHARRVCAALAYIALANLDRVSIHFFSSSLLGEPGAAQGKSEFRNVLDFLDNPPEPDGPTRLLHSMQAFTQRTRRRGLVFVLSDFFDPAGYEEPLAILGHARLEFHLLQILAPSELNPCATGDLRLVEIETGRTLELTATAGLLRRYHAEITAFNAALESCCLRRGAGFAQVTTGTAFEDTILRLLRGGVMLR